MRGQYLNIMIACGIILLLFVVAFGFYAKKFLGVSSEIKAVVKDWQVNGLIRDVLRAPYDRDNFADALAEGRGSVDFAKELRRVDGSFKVKISVNDVVLLDENPSDSESEDFVLPAYKGGLSKLRIEVGK